MCNNCSRLQKNEAPDFFDSQTEKYFVQLNKSVNKYESYLLETILRSSGIELKKTAEADEFFQEIESALQSIFVYGQELSLQSIEQQTKNMQTLASLDFKLKFTIEPRFATEYAKSQAGKLIKNVDEYTEREVRKMITASLNEGRTQKELTRVIYEKFAQYSAWRSKLIARQETKLALGGGKFEQFVESSKKYMTTGFKKAYSQQDSLVRPEHLQNENDGRIPATQPFSGTLSMFEPFGYNCRCVVTYRVFKPGSL